MTSDKLCMYTLTELLLLQSTTNKKYRKHHTVSQQQSHTLSLTADTMYEQRKTEEIEDRNGGKKGVHRTMLQLAALVGITYSEA